MDATPIRTFAEGLGVALPPADEFWRLGDRTGLRRGGEPARYFRSNYERGPLLYALVAHYRPQRVLEFGTGRGYGALCMAWAMADHAINGEIVTIDFMPLSQPLEWDIDWNDERGPRTERLTREAVWPQVTQPEWLPFLRPVTGTSAEVMASLGGAPIDFAFIDGDHGYAGVRHDFYALLAVAAEGIGILFDDYDGREEFGVGRLVEHEVAPYFDHVVLHNDGSWASSDGVASQAHAMAWARHRGAEGSLASQYPAAVRRAATASYRRQDALRRTLRRLRRWLRP